MSICSHGSEFVSAKQTHCWLDYVHNIKADDERIVVFHWQRRNEKKNGKYTSGSHSLYSIFAHNSRWRYRNTKCVRLLCCSLWVLFFSFTTPPTLLWLLVQTGSTVCPETEETTAADRQAPPTCSQEECQVRFPNFQPQCECDASGKPCSSQRNSQIKEKQKMLSQSLCF